MTGHEKFKAIVHYVVARRRNQPESLGAVKLNKIMWLSDLTAYYRRGRSITESRYIKREYGPVPAAIKSVLRELSNEGVLTIQKTEYFGKDKTTFVVHKPIADTERLSPEELDLIDSVIDHVCDKHTAKSISNATHDHIWKAAADGEELPLYTVFARPGKITDSEREWARLKIENESA